MPINCTRPGRTIYEFMWSEFADWYVEAAKVRLRDEPVDPAVATSAGVRPGAIAAPSASIHAICHRGIVAAFAASR